MALEALDQLIANKAWQRGEAKEVQAEASLVIRRYLEANSTCRRLEKTTSSGGHARHLPGPNGLARPPRRALGQADISEILKELPDLTHLGTLEAYRAFVLKHSPAMNMRDINWRPRWLE